MKSSAQTIAELGLYAIQGALAERCSTPLGAMRVASRPISLPRDALESEFAIVREALLLEAEAEALPLGGVTDLREAAQRAEKGAILDPSDLIRIGVALFAFEQAREFLAKRAPAYPRLREIAERLPQRRSLASRLDRSFDAAGALSDQASPALKSTRARRLALDRQLRERFDSLVREPAVSSKLQEPYFSIRDGRYVIPISSSHQAAIAGIVHGASQTGLTLFVEPASLVEFGNSLALAKAKEFEETSRILADLSRAVGADAPAISDGIEAIARLDEMLAVAKLAAQMRASIPDLVASSEPMELRALRHPRLALEQKEVIPSDLRLAPGSALVISGPNAGGKTICLTAVGLTSLIALSGLPIPAGSGSRIPCFSRIHAVVGDHQDLTKGLSTFSGHLERLRAILSEVDAEALVLVDEIAAGTDPREGAALAIAVIEAMLARGATVLVTTHLDALKAMAFRDQRFHNARVGFDSNRMVPIYRLESGLPGTSSPIAIARAVGLSTEVCTRAEELASDTGSDLAKALEAVASEQARLDSIRAVLESESQLLAQRRSEMEAQTAAFTKSRGEQLARFRGDLSAELQRARTQIRDLIDALKTKPSKEALTKAARDIARRIDSQPDGSRTDPDIGSIQVGDTARHLDFAAPVEVLAIDGDIATVSMGGMHTRVRLSQLAPGTQNASIGRAHPGNQEAEEFGDAVADVRGNRGEEAIAEVDKFVNRLAVAGRREGRIIHGHGQNVLKAMVRNYLKASPLIESFRPGERGEGGDGVTVFVM